jgi:hypothetical protein
MRECRVISGVEAEMKDSTFIPRFFVLFCGGLDGGDGEDEVCRSATHGSSILRTCGDGFENCEDDTRFS